MTFEAAVILGLFILAGIALGAKIIAGSLARSHQAALDHMAKQPRPIDVALAAARAELSKAKTEPVPSSDEVLPSLSPADPPLSHRSGLIYVSAPPDGVVTGGKINITFLEYLAKLRQEFPQLSIVAPVVHDHDLLPVMARMSQGKPLGGAGCEPLLQACDELWLIEYWGFAESDVVIEELAAAKRLGKTIRHFSPGSVLHLDVANAA